MSEQPTRLLTAQLAGVGQCAAHLIRHAKAVLECHPTQQQWAGQVITVLCEAAAAVTAAQADGRDHLDPELLAQLRRRYDEAVSWGIATNRLLAHPEHPRGVLPRPLLPSSYLVSTRGHHIRAIDAIHNALTGNPWLTTPATT